MREAAGLLDLPGVEAAIAALKELEALPVAERSDKLARAIQLIEGVGTPLVDGEEVIWVFPGRPEVETVTLDGGIHVDLQRLAGTDLFIGRSHLPGVENALISYTFEVDGTLERNPWTRAIFKGERSPLHVLRGSHVPIPEALHLHPGRPAGTVEKHRIQSVHLGEERNIWVYTPPNYSPRKQYAYLLAADGHLYFDGSIDLPLILDNLIGERLMPPVMAIGFAHGGVNRPHEYLWTHHRFEQHEAFVHREVLPWVQTRYQVYPKEGKHVALGFSNGGGWAFYSLALHAQMFAGAVLQSALTDVTQVPDLPTGKRVALAAGTLEPTAHNMADQFQHLLSMAGNQIDSRRYVGGHDVVLAEHHLVEALKFVFAR